MRSARTKAFKEFEYNFRNCQTLVDLIEGGGHLALDKLAKQANASTRKVAGFSLDKFFTLSPQQRVVTGSKANSKDVDEMKSILNKIDDSNTALNETLPNVLLSYLIELFEVYIQEIAVLIGLANPNLLGLQPQSITEELIREAVKKSLGGKLYNNLDSVLFKTNFNLSIDDAAKEASSTSKDLDRAKNIRNLYIHSRGMINSKFLKRYDDPNLTDKIGDKFPLTQDYVNTIAAKFFNTVTNLDEKASDKYPQILIII